MPTGIYERQKGDIDERFWLHVAFEDPVFPENGCMLWTGATVQGYGNFQKASRSSQGAHRWAYERYRGPVPEGLELDHLCRVRRCVNPDHLEPVSRRLHFHRSNATVQAVMAARTHCLNGHEFTPENTHLRTVEGRLSRQCRACGRAAAKRYRAKLT
jgi:hypothetical protein